MQKTISDIIRRGGFIFRPISGGWIVHYQGKSIGEIFSIREANGRPTFRLGFDQRKRPRSYRGMVVAAKALKAIATIKQKCRGQRAESLIIQAWESKTSGSLPQRK
jgi:hypothetical protein